jgi:transposase-like protein
MNYPLTKKQENFLWTFIERTGPGLTSKGYKIREVAVDVLRNLYYTEVERQVLLILRQYWIDVLAKYEPLHGK